MPTHTHMSILYIRIDLRLYHALCCSYNFKLKTYNLGAIASSFIKIRLKVFLDKSPSGF